MTRIVLLVFSLICTTTVFSQPAKTSQTSQTNNNEVFYAFDKDWKGTTMKKAVYLGISKKIDDTCWQFDTYHVKGPLIRSERFKNDKYTVRHGRTIIYKASGQLDTICKYADNLAHGTWQVINAKGKVTAELEYDQGQLIATKDPSLKDPYADTPKDDAKKESEFPGAIEGWGRYLRANLRYPQRAIDMSLQGQVNVAFVVDKDGTVLDPMIFRSVEYSLDAEAYRIITSSPAWIPAVQFGKPVKSYKIQPIVFKLR